MSEQILERNVATSASGAVPGLPPGGEAVDKAAGRNRTFLVVALAVIAGLVLGGLALFFMQPGSDDELAAEPVAGGAAPGSSVPAGGAVPAGQAAGTGASAGSGSADAVAADPAAAPKQATARLTSRDPFAPLIAKKAAPAPAPVVAPDAGSSSVVPGPTVPAESVPAPSTPATGGTISALSVSPLGTSVTLKLDGKKYEVDEGETFAKSYRLYDIFNANCAGFLYGDQNAVVCEGDSVTVG